MNRIRLEWSNLWDILGEHFNQVICWTVRHKHILTLCRFAVTAIPTSVPLPWILSVSYQCDFWKRKSCPISSSKRTSSSPSNIRWFTMPILIFAIWYAVYQPILMILTFSTGFAMSPTNDTSQGTKYAFRMAYTLWCLLCCFKSANWWGRILNAPAWCKILIILPLPQNVLRIPHSKSWRDWTRNILLPLSAMVLSQIWLFASPSFARSASIRR